MCTTSEPPSRRHRRGRGARLARRDSWHGAKRGETHRHHGMPKYQRRSMALLLSDPASQPSPGFLAQAEGGEQALVTSTIQSSYRLGRPSKRRRSVSRSVRACVSPMPWNAPTENASRAICGPETESPREAGLWVAMARVHGAEYRELPAIIGVFSTMARANRACQVR